MGRLARPGVEVVRSFAIVEVVRSFAIIVTAANAAMAPIHGMPVILEPADWPVWLGEA